jgi:hypothetical protein
MTTGDSGRRNVAKQQPEQLILGGRVRRDVVGITLFGISALGLVLNGVVFPGLGRIGGILQQVSTGILFGRVLLFAASGVPRRQGMLPRSLTVAELIVDGVATIIGFWACIMQPLLNHRVELSGRAGSSLRARQPIPQGMAQAVTVSRVAAVASFVVHTLRLSIYLSPSRGLRESAASGVPI